VTKKKSGGKGGWRQDDDPHLYLLGDLRGGAVQGADHGRSSPLDRSQSHLRPGVYGPGNDRRQRSRGGGIPPLPGHGYADAADARMQATLGVANTPAWRGLAYLVFYDLQPGPLREFARGRAGAGGDCHESPGSLQINAYATGFNTYPATNSNPLLAYGAGIYVWIPNEGDLYHSTTYYTSTDNGATWTSRIKVNAVYNYRELCYVGGLFIYGTVQDLYTSSDGINWSSRINLVPGEFSIPVFVHTGSLYVGTYWAIRLIYIHQTA
jgi:hypothetical protein